MFRILGGYCYTRSYMGGAIGRPMEDHGEFEPIGFSHIPAGGFAFKDSSMAELVRLNRRIRYRGYIFLFLGG